jgi:hypothetical protein
MLRIDLVCVIARCVESFLDNNDVKILRCYIGYIGDEDGILFNVRLLINSITFHDIYY